MKISQAALTATLAAGLLGTSLIPVDYAAAAPASRAATPAVLAASPLAPASSAVPAASLRTPAVNRAAAYPGPTGDADLDFMLASNINWLAREYKDKNGKTLPNAFRRYILVNTANVNDVNVNIYKNKHWVSVPSNVARDLTAQGMALQFTARYCRATGQWKACNLTKRLANDFVATQLGTSAGKVRQGGWAHNTGHVRTFSNGHIVLGMVEAFRATKNPAYRTSAIKGANFLLRMENPNKYYSSYYGTKVLADTRRGGFMEMVSSTDQVTARSTTISSVAGAALREAYKMTGNKAYDYAVIRARKFYKVPAQWGHEYYSWKITGSKYVRAAGGEAPDGKFHRRAVNIKNGKPAGIDDVDGDAIEYVLWSLYRMRLPVTDLRPIYGKYAAMPSETQITWSGTPRPWDHAKFDAEACWQGYIRVGSYYSDKGGGAHYGAYHELQSAGTLAGVKGYLARGEHFFKSIPLLKIAPFRSAFVGQNDSTGYYKSVLAKPGASSWYKSHVHGTVSMSQIGIGVLDYHRISGY